MRMYITTLPWEPVQGKLSFDDLIFRSSHLQIFFRRIFSKFPSDIFKILKGKDIPKDTLRSHYRPSRSPLGITHRASLSLPTRP